MTTKTVIQQQACPGIQAERYELPLELERRIAGGLCVSAQAEHPPRSGTYAPNPEVLTFAIQLNMEVADLSSGHTNTLDEHGGAKVEIVRGAASLEVKACLAF
ncbi:MAG: hypothetical protein WCD04_18880 [Terriglobia bacterium]